MKVTEYEMEVLKMVLNGYVSHGKDRGKEMLGEPLGSAIELMRLWRSRGVSPSEFDLIQEKSPLALSPSSSPPLSLHSLSSPLTPPLTNPPQGLSGDFLAKKTKKRLTVSLVLNSVTPDLTLNSGAFLIWWKQWIENRMEIGAVTLRAFSQHLKTCERLGESKAIEAIQHSIQCGYRAIFEPPNWHQPMQRKSVTKVTKTDLLDRYHD